jgi:hypothetical protein
MNEDDLKELNNLRVILYFFQSPDIKISQILYFSDDRLVFEGYDIGKRVEEAFGDSDYEYDFEVPKEEVGKFYPLFNVTPGDKKGLLLKLYERFAGNYSYSQMRDFMQENGIDSRGVSWT